MAGNVWEWCLETHGGKSGKENGYADPRVARVVRGGSWDDDLRFARASCRSRGDPGDRGSNVGFRFVCASPISW